MNGSGARDFLCTGCRNRIGMRYPDGHVVSRHKGREIRILAGGGEITCEECDGRTPVDKEANAVVA